MRATLLLKIALRNVGGLRPAYLALLRRNCALLTAEHRTADDMFILVSCINTADNPVVRHVPLGHGTATRFAETVRALESVRRHHPNAYIVLLENSKVDAVHEDKLRGLSDEYHNYRNDDFVRPARRHFNKGVPQFATLIKFLEENGSFFRVRTFHFLAARYSLERNVSVHYAEPGTYFRHYPIYDVVSTRYFFFKGGDVRSLITAFRRTMYCALLGSSVEAAIHGFSNRVHLIEELGIFGWVNGEEFVRE